MDASPAATRTRRAIVEAAVACWSEDSSASLGEVAARAGVGRSTLNRHFAGREELVAAVDEVSRERLTAAIRAARPEEGTGLEALTRMAVALLEQEDVLGLVFADNALVDPDTWEDEPSQDPHGVPALVARGHRDGTIDPGLPAEWVETVLWTSLFAAVLTLRGGTRTRHEVGALLARTLGSGVGGAS
ncbi:TetR/AcrR family transcriptional regulator [Auraticoccus monumenti]|uniref:DNA-binding transcriptional regulator, AcrR family n=1 Tax=Auraticoccus monumenti TaxID=675864 RepID=A0A1G6ZCX2_9ACTN|nr:TetR/AcrR family transcriptional regulator [Auraticoccus monumenti]SDE00509.1 DNA-binding transcriptional regulator, AcrR family [Auraticoccus monumenti]